MGSANKPGAAKTGGSSIRSEKQIHLSNGLSVGIREARRILNDVSKTTLHRWADFGIENKVAEQLLILHIEQRVMPSTKHQAPSTKHQAPSTKDWKGWTFNHEGDLCCARHVRKKGMDPYQLEQTLFLQNLFIQQSEVVEQIRDSLFAINGRLAHNELLGAPENIESEILPAHQRN